MHLCILQLERHRFCLMIVVTLFRGRLVKLHQLIDGLSTCRVVKHVMKRGLALEVMMFLFLALLSSPQEAFGAEKPRRRPIQVLEVSRPPDVPPGATEICAQVLVQHVFGNSIDEAPVVRPYTPRCGASQWSRVVLRWTASCTGRQFDRISAVWLGGVEVLRTCTAEPVKRPGIEWTVEKDVTRYSSLWKHPQMVALELANVLVADSLTGLYDVTLSVHFYNSGPRGGETEAPSNSNLKPSGGETEAQSVRNQLKSSGGETEAETKKRRAAFKSSSYGDSRAVADVILPFPSSSSASSPSNPWFRIHGESDAQTRRIPNIPRNAYRATVEICVSFHERDEFWYANKPNEYFAANNFTDAENGPFREILVTIDDLLAGAVNPFPVIYTGGFNPFFWRPVTAIGSFVLPSYNIDITPFLAHDNDPNPKFTVSVTNALPFWLLGLNLHIWVDANSATNTRGAMVRHIASISTKENSNFLALDGTFLIKTTRVVSCSGWLASSFGNLTTDVASSTHFSHSLVVSDGGNGLSVHQESVTDTTVVVKSDESSLIYDHGVYKFPLRLFVHQRPSGQFETFLQKASIDHAWEEERQWQQSGGGVGFFSSMKNRQQAHGKLLVPPVGENRGVATTKQILFYDGSGGCYFRSLGVGNNGSYLFDHSHTRCT